MAACRNTDPLQSALLTTVFHLFQNTTIYLSLKNGSQIERDENDQALQACQIYFSCIVAHNLYFQNRYEIPADSGLFSEREVYVQHFNSHLEVYGKLRHHPAETTVLLLPSSQSQLKLMDSQNGNRTRAWKDTVFHSINNLIQDSTRVPFPTYTVALVTDQTTSSITSLHADLPKVLGFSKFLAFLNVHDEIVPMIACYSCPKDFLSSFSDFYPPNWKEMAATFVLHNIRGENMQTSDDISKIWKKLNQDTWNDFGVPGLKHKTTISKQVNMDSLFELFEGMVKNGLAPKLQENVCRTQIYESPPKLIEQKPFDWPNSCAVETLCSRKNYTPCTGIEILWEQPIFYYLGMEHERWKYPFLKYHFPAVGVSQRGFKYFTILGNMESSKRIPMDFRRLLEPLPQSIWIPFSITFVWLACILSPSNLISVDFENWLFWLLGVALEQRDDMRIQRNKRNSHLIIIWMLSMFFMRNLYCFSMYSLLAAPTIPNDLPQSKYDLMEMMTQRNASVRTYLSTLAHYQLYFRIVANGTFSNFLKVFLEKGVEMEDFGAESQHDVVKNISGSLPSSCRYQNASNPWDNLEFSCDTGSRFSFVYPSEDQPALPLLLGMASTKVMHFPPNSEKFITEPAGYVFEGNNIFTTELIKTMTSFVEAGIMNYLKEWRNIRKTVLRVKYSEDWTDDKLYHNREATFSFAQQFYRVNSKREFFQGLKSDSILAWIESNDDQDSYEPVKIEEVGTVFIVYMILCIASCVTYAIEFIIRK